LEIEAEGGLARQRGARLAALDAGLAAVHPDVAELIPHIEGT
jgi:hypothetical protein